jgi:hypothetical protein
VLTFLGDFRVLVPVDDEDVAKSFDWFALGAPLDLEEVEDDDEEEEARGVCCW